MVKIKIKLTRTLPIDAKHGCTEGKEFDAKYQNTYVGEDGVERLLRTRGTPVEFTGIDGALCVAFSYEYEVIQ